MTSTHDLATVAGWWRERDLDWREKLGQAGTADREERTADRARLWQAFAASGAAQGEQPAPDETARAVDAACAHIGRSACELVMLPLEDALAAIEQPNLPGTLNEHPNWRRRTTGAADTLLGRSSCRCPTRHFGPGPESVMTDHQEERTSFLQKRNKKLLSPGARDASGADRNMRKFFGSSFQKRTLCSSLEIALS